MQLGMIGLGRMGSNMVRRLMRGGHQCVVFDLKAAAVRDLENEGATGSESLPHLVEQLATPRVVWLMVPAGAPTEATITSVVEHLEAGDIVIDGGNSFYKDDVRRARELRTRGIEYADVGTSGGVWGLDRGYCLMFGAEPTVAEYLDPILSTLAPGRGEIDATPGHEQAVAAGTLGRTADRGYLHCGPPGSGHFVKMIPNGIEYGLLQAYGEGLEILRQLEKLIKKQQQLLDETFRRAQGNSDQPGPSGMGNSQSEARQGGSSSGAGDGESQLGLSRQQSLRAALGELMRRWGASGQSIPLPLNRASRAMREALQALSAGLPGQAVGPQTSAVDEMSQGAQSLLQSMMEALGQAPSRPGGLTGGFGNNLDPLGRGLLGRGYQDDNRTRIPDEADMQRSREILDELYRRAGEFQRPAIERDYIKRLLKRF